MTLKHLLDNKYIYVDPELDRYEETIDCYSVVVEVTKTHVYLINSYLKSEYLMRWAITDDEDDDIKPNDIYIRRILSFYDSEKNFYSKDYVTYDKDDGEYLPEFLTSLKDCWKYKSDIQFRRSVDISIICEDLNYIKEFF